MTAVSRPGGAIDAPGIARRIRGLARPSAHVPILPRPGLLRPGRSRGSPRRRRDGPVLVLVSLVRAGGAGLSQRDRGRDHDGCSTGRPRLIRRPRVSSPSCRRRGCTIRAPMTKRRCRSRAADLGRRGAACGRRAGLSQQPRLRASAPGLRAAAVRRHGGRDHGSDRRRPLGPRSDIVHPGLAAPTAELPAGPGDVWAPERSSAGPLSLLVSIADRRCYAYRNGIEIGSAAASFARPEEPLLPACSAARPAARDGQPGLERGRPFGPGRSVDALGRARPAHPAARHSTRCSHRCWCRARRFIARSARPPGQPHRPRFHRASARPA